MFTFAPPVNNKPPLAATTLPPVPCVIATPAERPILEVFDVMPALTKIEPAAPASMATAFVAATALVTVTMPFALISAALLDVMPLVEPSCVVTEPTVSASLSVYIRLPVLAAMVATLLPTAVKSTVLPPTSCKPLAVIVPADVCVMDLPATADRPKSKPAVFTAAANTMLPASDCTAASPSVALLVVMPLIATVAPP